MLRVQGGNPVRSYFYGILVTVIILLATSANIRAQSVWAGATLRGQLSKTFTAELEQQFRFDQGGTTFNSTYTEAALRIRPAEYFILRGAYRYIYVPGNCKEGNPNRQRWIADAINTIGSDKTTLVFTHRLRFQKTWEINGGNQAKQHFLRSRAGLSYNLSAACQPYLEHELFFWFDRQNRFETQRFTAGLNLQLTSQWGVNSFLRLEGIPNDPLRKRAFIIGLMGVYEFRLDAAAEDGKKPASSDKHND